MAIGLAACLWGRGGPVVAAIPTPRVDNTTLRLPASAPSTDYTFESVLPYDLTNTVVTVASPPGETNRLFVAELPGLVRVIPDLSNPRMETFLDLRSRTRTGEGEEHGLCSIVFHPGYATNGQFFVFYSWNPPGATEVHNRLSRFRVDPSNPNRALESSEEPLISQLDRHPWHNSGDMHFDRNGYLFVSLGDEGAEYGYENAGLFDRNFFSAVIRIDPDQRPGGVLPSPHPAVFPGTYTVPADNPFFGRTNYVIGTDVLPITLDPEHIRGEFYAVGFRNPWRFSIDAATGTIYCNDVGLASREEIDVLVPGANYGWVLKEGSLPWPFWVPASGLTDPVHEYEHTEGRIAITGSLFYRGSRYPELDGTYVFGDFGGQLSQIRPLPDGHFAPEQELHWWAGLVTLGVDPSTGDILMGGLDGVARLLKRDHPGDPLPAHLSETGIFSDLKTLAPNPGVIPYSVNQVFWSDHAIKQRWFCVPKAADKVHFEPEDPWTAPTGTVWVKHFDFPIDSATPPATRRLETRVLAKTSDGIYGATYRWNADGTDADLVPGEGQETDLETAGPDGVRVQRWRFPGRGECLQCHTAVAGHALSFNTAQLNHDEDANGTRRNLLEMLSEAGYLEGFEDARPNLLPRLPALDDETWSREARIKGFLAANCVQCHQPGGATRAVWDARLETPLENAGILGATAIHPIDLADTKIVAPGDLTNSSIYVRLAGLGPLHMPPLGTFVVNTQIVSLVAAWITNDLPAHPSYAQWTTNQFGAGNVVWFGAPEQDPDGDGLPNRLEYQLGTSPTERFDRWIPELTRDRGGVRLRFTRKANRSFVVESSDSLASPYWRPVDIPENRVYFPAKDEVADIRIPATDAIRLYRIRFTTP